MPLTATELKQMLRSAGLRPRKALGQHFLIDPNLLRCLAEAAGLDPQTVVLEVGCGPGNLTELLLDAGMTVVAVEIDTRLAAIAAANLRAYSNLHLLTTDILSKVRLDRRVVELLDRLIGRADCKDWALVANLPYNVASPLLIELAYLPENPPKSMCFTVQREVADRLAAKPGTKAYGPLTVLIQALFEVRLLRRVGPAAFYPPPAVGSAMVRLDSITTARKSIYDLKKFRELVNLVFRHRRKTIATGWIKRLDEAKRAQAVQACKAAGIDVSIRAESIAVPQFVIISNALSSESP